MPKELTQESVLHDWVHRLPFQQQALLLTAMRGPDGMSKENPAKCLVRYLRGVVLKPAGDWHGANDNSFMWGDYDQLHGDSQRLVFDQCIDDLFSDPDQYPHHFLMHLFHCAEVVAYKHPSQVMRNRWTFFYAEACKALHMTPEREEQMDERLDDFNCGIHAKTRHTCPTCGLPEGSPFGTCNNDFHFPF